MSMHSFHCRQLTLSALYLTEHLQVFKCLLKFVRAIPAADSGNCIEQGHLTAASNTLRQHFPTLPSC